MNKESMNQIYYLNRELRAWEEELDELREISIQSPQPDGMPKAVEKTDKTGNLASRTADIESIIQSIVDAIHMAKIEIYAYIKTLDDSLMRQIILYRCIRLKTWCEVAAAVGGGNTAESVRKMFDRHFEKTDNN